jgi:hypothetical protein
MMAGMQQERVMTVIIRLAGYWRKGRGMHQPGRIRQQHLCIRLTTTTLTSPTHPPTPPTAPPPPTHTQTQPALPRTPLLTLWWATVSCGVHSC